MRRPLLVLFARVASIVAGVNGTTGASAAGAGAAGRAGYWMLGSDGAVFAFGGAQYLGDQTAGQGSVDLEPSPSGDGDWILSKDGAIDAFGDARGRISIDRDLKLQRGEEATSISVTPSGDGLWVFTSTGRVVAYGDAGQFGDMSGTALNGPVLDSIATPSGRGYYIVASDGGIFAFDAPFRGSMGGSRLNKPVVGMVRYGDGYLMVGADGGMFNFSSLPFSGSLGDRTPASPIVAVAAFEPVDLSTNPPVSNSSNEDGQATTTTSTTTTSSTMTTTTTTTTAPSSPGGDPSEVVTGEPPTHVLPCNDGSGQDARVWYYGPEHEETTWAAQNPCRDQWIVMDFPGASASDPYGSGLSVAPGTAFHDPVGGRFQADEEGWEQIELSPRPFDGTRGCPVGYGLWEYLNDGQFHFIVSCPDADELGWYDDEDGEPYTGPTCFGLEPDIFAYDTGETFAAPGGTGPWVIMGGAGDDTFRQDWYSHSQPVYFCGGGGNDTVEGYVTAFDGGDGTDTARVFNCTLNGAAPQVTNVEDLTWLPCRDPS